jgi:hypothetical protein
VKDYLMCVKHVAIIINFAGWQARFFISLFPEGRMWPARKRKFTLLLPQCRLGLLPKPSPLGKESFAQINGYVARLLTLAPCGRGKAMSDSDWQGEGYANKRRGYRPLNRPLMAPYADSLSREPATGAWLHEVETLPSLRQHADVRLTPVEG